MAKRLPRGNEEFSDFYARANRTRDLIVQKFETVIAAARSRRDELLNEVEHIEELHREEERVLEKELGEVEKSRTDSWVHVDATYPGISSTQHSSFITMGKIDDKISCSVCSCVEIRELLITSR